MTQTLAKFAIMKPRVLIVDDEPDVVELVEFKLAGLGFEVLRAGNGIEALRKARCDSPDVIVLDVMLPDLDGLSVCEILRSQPSTRDVPVVILSALDRPAPRSRGAKVHFSHWVKKGADLGSLCDCVGAALIDRLDRVRTCFTTEE